MLYRRLGRSGLELSVISLGTWATIGETLDIKNYELILGTAYDLGINYFDTAETYANGRAESEFGLLLKKFRWPRETFVISGKVFWGTNKKCPNTWRLSRKHIIEGCNATLKRLKLDHLDIFLCHRADPDTPFEETVLAMNTLIQQGKILYWGTSEWSTDQYLAAYHFATSNNLYAPITEQLQYNIFHRKKVEEEFMLLQEKIGLGITCWSPLKSGLLADKYTNGIPSNSRLGKKGNEWLVPEIMGVSPEKRLKQVCALKEFAYRELGISIQQFALAWCIYNQSIASAITGASDVSHIKEAIVAIEAVKKFNLNIMGKVDNILEFYK